MERDTFSAALAHMLDGVYMIARADSYVIAAEHMGDGAVSVRLADGSQFNVNITRAD